MVSEGGFSDNQLAPPRSPFHLTGWPPLLFSVSDPAALLCEACWTVPKSRLVVEALRLHGSVTVRVTETCAEFVPVVVVMVKVIVPVYVPCDRLVLSTPRDAASVAPAS